MDEEVKYVRLRGFGQIGFDEEGRLTLTMCDPDGQPLAGVERVFFSHIPGQRRSLPDGTSVINPPIKFLDIDLLAQFNQQDFNRYQPLWSKIQPGLTWQNALVPTPLTMPNMNPTGPPKP